MESGSLEGAVHGELPAGAEVQPERGRKGRQTYVYIYIYTHTHYSLKCVVGKGRYQLCDQISLKEEFGVKNC